MKNKVILFTFCFFSMFRGISQNARLDEAELIRLEIDWHNAFKFKDSSILHRVLADDYVHINSRGNQNDKKQEIQGLISDNAVYDTIYPYDMQFRHFGNMVAVTGKSKEAGLQNGKSFENFYFWTDLFVKKKDQWQCVLAQTAPLPRPGIIINKNLVPKDSFLVKETNAALLNLLKSDTFSGVVLIAKNNVILYQGVFGQASKEFNAANDIHTAFNLASMTKMFTGIAMAQLAEQKKISFDDSIKQFLPDLPSNLTSGITIHHLLTHTSGLHSYFTDEFHHSNHAAFRNLNDYTRFIKNDSPEFLPGSRWLYSNTGYLLLGLIVERVSGLSYFEYVKTQIFEKAGMRSSAFYEMDRPNKNVATPYTKNNRYLKDSINWTVPVFIGPVKGSPAGGAYSSALDLLHFSEALLKNRLLKDNTRSLLERAVTYDKPERQKKYGYGFATQVVNSKLIVFHDGGANGISTNMDIYPELGYVVVLLSNYDFPAGMSVNNRIREIITK